MKRLKIDRSILDDEFEKNDRIISEKEDIKAFEDRISHGLKIYKSNEKQSSDERQNRSSSPSPLGLSPQNTPKKIENSTTNQSPTIKTKPNVSQDSKQNKSPSSIEQIKDEKKRSFTSASKTAVTIDNDPKKDEKKGSFTSASKTAAAIDNDPKKDEKTGPSIAAPKIAAPIENYSKNLSSNLNTPSKKINSSDSGSKKEKPVSFTATSPKFEKYKAPIPSNSPSSSIQVAQTPQKGSKTEKDSEKTGPLTDDFRNRVQENRSFSGNSIRDSNHSPSSAFKKDPNHHYDAVSAENHISQSNVLPQQRPKDSGSSPKASIATPNKSPEKNYSQLSSSSSAQNHDSSESYRKSGHHHSPRDSRERSTHHSADERPRSHSSHHSSSHHRHYHEDHDERQHSSERERRGYNRRDENIPAQVSNLNENHQFEEKETNLSSGEQKTMDNKYFSPLQDSKKTISQEKHENEKYESLKKQKEEKEKYEKQQKEEKEKYEKQQKEEKEKYEIEKKQREEKEIERERKEREEKERLGREKKEREEKEKERERVEREEKERLGREKKEREEKERLGREKKEKLERERKDRERFIIEKTTKNTETSARRDMEDQQNRQNFGLKSKQSEKLHNSPRDTKTDDYSKIHPLISTPKQSEKLQNPPKTTKTDDSPNKHFENQKDNSSNLNELKSSAPFDIEPKPKNSSSSSSGGAYSYAKMLNNSPASSRSLNKPQNLIQNHNNLQQMPETTPKQNIPPENTPQQTFAPENIPKQNIPPENTPKQSIAPETPKSNQDNNLDNNSRKINWSEFPKVKKNQSNVEIFPQNSSKRSVQEEDYNKSNIEDYDEDYNRRKNRYENFDEDHNDHYHNSSPSHHNYARNGQYSNSSGHNDWSQPTDNNNKHNFARKDKDSSVYRPQSNEFNTEKYSDNHYRNDNDRNYSPQQKDQERRISGNSQSFHQAPPHLTEKNPPNQEKPKDSELSLENQKQQQQTSKPQQQPIATITSKPQQPITKATSDKEQESSATKEWYKKFLGEEDLSLADNKRKSSNYASPQRLVPSRSQIPTNISLPPSMPPKSQIPTNTSLSQSPNKNSVAEVPRPAKISVVTSSSKIDEIMLPPPPSQHQQPPIPHIPRKSFIPTPNNNNFVNKTSPIPSQPPTPVKSALSTTTTPLKSALQTTTTPLKPALPTTTTTFSRLPGLTAAIPVPAPIFIDISDNKKSDFETNYEKPDQKQDLKPPGADEEIISSVVSPPEQKKKRNFKTLTSNFNIDKLKETSYTPLSFPDKKQKEGATKPDAPISEELPKKKKRGRKSKREKEIEEELKRNQMDKEKQNKGSFEVDAEEAEINFDKIEEDEDKDAPENKKRRIEGENSSLESEEKPKKKRKLMKKPSENLETEEIDKESTTTMDLDPPTIEISGVSDSMSGENESKPTTTQGKETKRRKRIIRRHSLPEQQKDQSTNKPKKPKLTPKKKTKIQNELQQPAEERKKRKYTKRKRPDGEFDKKELLMLKNREDIISNPKKEFFFSQNLMFGFIEEFMEKQERELAEREAIISANNSIMD